MLREHISYVLFQIVDCNLRPFAESVIGQGKKSEHNEPVTFVAVFIQLQPRSHGALCIEHRAMNSSLLSRGQFFPPILAIDPNNINLLKKLESNVRNCDDPILTFCFVCQASGNTGSFVVYMTWFCDTSKSSVPPNGSTGEHWNNNQKRDIVVGKCLRGSSLPINLQNVHRKPISGLDLAAGGR